MHLKQRFFFRQVSLPRGIIKEHREKRHLADKLIGSLSALYKKQIQNIIKYQLFAMHQK